MILKNDYVVIILFTSIVLRSIYLKWEQRIKVLILRVTFTVAYLANR